MKKYDVIITLAFGLKKDGSATTSNEDLAQETIRELTGSQSAIVQQEIFDLIPDEKRSQVKCVRRTNNGYIHTRTVLLRALEKGKRYGWENKKFLLVVHPAHRMRSIRVAKKLGLECTCPIYPNIRYDKKSAQWWTRSKFLFWLREIPVLCYYKLRGWI